ncbi:MAG TPA: DsrE family protein [Roseomonas sp.]|nr:DsrE family protein [Roseomonas sp.]
MDISRRLGLALLPALGLGGILAGGGARAAANDPLFINLTSDDGHRVAMALAFGGNQLRLGHPLTIFLNDRAVHVALRAQAGRYAEQQATIATLQQAGATFLVCPMCLRHYGGSEADLLPGLRLGSPEQTGAALFRDGTRALTW